jgi:uncharacterized membrane protein
VQQTQLEGCYLPSQGPTIAVNRCCVCHAHFLCDAASFAVTVTLTNNGVSSISNVAVTAATDTTVGSTTTVSLGTGCTTLSSLGVGAGNGRQCTLTVTPAQAGLNAGNSIKLRATSSADGFVISSAVAEVAAVSTRTVSVAINPSSTSYTAGERCSCVVSVCKTGTATQCCSLTAVPRPFLEYRPLYL